MRKFFPIVLPLILAGALVPAQAAVVSGMPAAAAETTSAEEVGQEFLQATSDLWFLLSGIRDKDDADRAADRFSELVRKVCDMDERLSEMSMSAPLPMEDEDDDDACAGRLDDVQIRILDSFDDLNNEFTSLCRVKCYGSRKLTQAFQEAVATGMFAEDGMVMLHEMELPMSEEQAQQELVRLKRLVEPDRAVLEVLEKVKDAGSADKAVAELSRISQRLSTLMPDMDMNTHAMPASAAPSVQEAFAPLEPLLWGIRNELVRIAGLPGYEAEPYDNFSAALETVFDSLGKTHSEYFDSVFDSYFREDLDEAAHDKATTSK